MVKVFVANTIFESIYKEALKTSWSSLATTQQIPFYEEEIKIRNQWILIRFQFHYQNNV